MPRPPTPKLRLFSLPLASVLSGVWAEPVPADSGWAVDTDAQFSEDQWHWGSHDSLAGGTTVQASSPPRTHLWACLGADFDFPGGPV